MEREVNVNGIIELSGIRVQGLFKELASLYVAGKIREEDVEKRFSTEIRFIIKDYRNLRDQAGQLKLTGELFIHQLDGLRRDLGDLKIDKFVELRWMKMDENFVRFKVCITVLSAGAHFFRASLANGLLHEEGWDKFLTITE